MCGSVVKTPFDTSVMSVDILEATEFPSQPMAQVDQRENQPRCEKTGLRGFRPDPTQTGLYSHRRWLEG